MAFSKIIMNGQTLMDVTQDTVTANKLKSGETATKNDGTKITGTLEPGGSTDGDVVFIDYDGSVVTAKTKAEINAMESDSDLPENPTHTRLTAQGWNWTVAQLKAQLTAMPDQKVYVGQMYITESGATEIDIELVDDFALSPYLCLGISINGSVTINWGDNSATDTVTGTGITSRIYTQHVYQTTGNYTISITVNSGTFRFYVTNTQPILNDKTSSSQYPSKKYSSSIKRIRLGENVDSNSIFRDHYSLESITIPSGTTITSNAFYNCYSITSITIPSGVTSIGNNTFSYCHSIISIAIPSGVTSIGDGAFNSCHSITSITIPSSITSIGNSVFYYCYSLTSIIFPSEIINIGSYAYNSCYSIKSITIPSKVASVGSYTFQNLYSLTSVTIPSSVTSLLSSAFSSCYSLASITIPSSVTSIGNSAFSSCYSMLAYHLEPTTPPTLGTAVFSNIQSDCKIFVPYSADHSILNAYKTDTNWVFYESYIYEEEAAP